jgi:hypothetical protein
MYRQVRVHPSQRKYQSILWRNNQSEELKVYELCTVTYGTTAAPYLATRSVIQLSLDEEEQFPRASEFLRNGTYVDDCLAGANSLKEALEIKNQLIQLLELGQFALHKWCANTQEILQDITPEDQEINKTISDKSTVKTLGVTWNTKRDSFVFQIRQEPTATRTITKRTVLSSIATFFDPLGITEPICFSAKLFMQRPWQKGYNWDDNLDQEDTETWTQFHNQLVQMNEIQINRCLFTDTPINIQLHGFSDASTQGYGAVIYVRAIYGNGNCTTNLLCARSRVAPLKTITIPKLELCGAQVLANLMSKI